MMSNYPPEVPAPLAILDQIPQAEREIFNAYLTEVTFSVGDCFIHQGDKGDGCYFILRGAVRVELHDGTGPPTVLGYIETGGVVGEMSMVGMPTRTASVYAQADVTATWLSATSYERLVRDAPAVAATFGRIALKEMTRKMSLTTARLASYLSSEMTLDEGASVVERAIATQNRFVSDWAANFLSVVPSDKEIVDAFLDRGIDTFCMVADSVLGSMDQYLMDLSMEGKVNRWVVPSERTIPAVAAGRWLATGQLLLMSMQNTGFTNAMDYLRSVMLIHNIPGIVMTSWRGFDAQLDDSEPHILVGEVADVDNINTLGRHHVFGHRTGIGLLHEVRAAIDDAFAGNVSCVRVSPPGFSRSYRLREVSDCRLPCFDPEYYAALVEQKGRRFAAVQRAPRLTREEALLNIHEEMKPQSPFYIVGNGFNPRAIQALRFTENTFENAGGMGSSLAIAWGAAKSNPLQVFVAIEGDQNAVMNEMEKVLTSDYPDNLYWYILNNGTGESVGPSLSLPLSPWHYDLARVINTNNGPPGSFKHSRINASGLKFASDEAKELAAEIGNLPAQAHLARRLLARKLASA